MCSLGHHDHEEDVRPPRRRRHLDDTARRQVAETPRAALRQRKADKHKQMRAEIAAERETFQPDMEGGQYELIPLDQQQLPDCRVGEPGLPDPRTLYYSAAREG